MTRGDRVEIVSGEDAGAVGRVRDVAGAYVVVELPDGSALRTGADNVRRMESPMITCARCPYCTKSVALERGALGSHRAVAGVCDGAGRLVDHLDHAGRAVFATSTVTPQKP